MPDGSYEGAADSRREGVARMLPPAQPARRHGPASAQRARQRSGVTLIFGKPRSSAPPQCAHWLMTMSG